MTIAGLGLKVKVIISRSKVNAVDLTSIEDSFSSFAYCELSKCKFS